MADEEKTNLEKFLALVEDNTSDSMERLNYRIKNRDMLRASQRVALSILRELRKIEWSKEKLAEETGIPIEEINLILKGSENLTLGIIVKFEKVLNISLLTNKHENIFTKNDVEEKLRAVIIDCVNSFKEGNSFDINDWLKKNL